MKKMFFLVIAFAFTCMHAQNYPGKKPELLIGKEVKVIAEPPIELGYQRFYTDLKMNNASVYKPESAYSSFTTKEELAGKTFKVLSVNRKAGVDETEIALQLQGDAGLVLYYGYEDDFPYDFPFTVIGGLKVGKDFYCSYVSKVNTTTYTTDGTDGVTFLKEKKNNITKYYVTLNVPGADSKAGKKNAVIYMGTKKIEKSNINVKSEENTLGTYYYTAVFEITAADVELLKVNKITKTQLGKYTTNITEGEVLKGSVACLTTK